MISKKKLRRLRLERVWPNYERLIKAFKHAELVCYFRLHNEEHPHYNFEEEKNIALESFYKLYSAAETNDSDNIAKNELENWCLTSFNDVESLIEWENKMNKRFFELYHRVKF